MWHVHRHKTNITLIKNQLHQYSSWIYDYATAFSKKKKKLLSPKNNVSENVWSRYQWNYVIANSKQLILVDAWYYESTIDNILEMCKERDQNRYVSSLLHH